MRRREFITLLGGASAVWPLASRAQQPARSAIGFLNPNGPNAYPDVIAAFRAGLHEQGYVEGENVTIAYRWAEGHPERLPALAADLVRMRVNVIAATGGGDAALAAKAATQRIPIVFNSADDPVKTGLVVSLNRPGGNLTGVSQLGVELTPKRLELLKEAVPNVANIAFLVEADSAVAASGVAQDIARKFGTELWIVRRTAQTPLGDVFAKLAQSGTKALLIGGSSYFNSRSRELAEMCLRYRLLGIYQGREFTAAGGLMSYGPSLASSYRVVGEYTGRVLKGALPRDLPVQQQTKIDLFINLKTAKAFGLTISSTVLAFANEVIE